MVAADFRILGPLEVFTDGRLVPIHGAKQQMLLALLVVHAGEVVPVERLIDELWEAGGPASAAQSVQMHVSRLRRALAEAGERVVTRPPGYMLVAGPDETDVGRFEGFVAMGRARRRSAEVEAARVAFAAAEAAWRGDPLGGVGHGSELAAEASRLEEMRLETRLDRIECDLELGAHGEVVGELEALRRRRPLQERIPWLLMLALYRCGRQADALEVYRDTRTKLIDEVGVEPGDDLQRLQAQILRHDPSLAPRDSAA